jgi:hypothetical protein
MSPDNLFYQWTIERTVSSESIPMIRVNGVQQKSGPLQCLPEEAEHILTIEGVGEAEALLNIVVYETFVVFDLFPKSESRCFMVLRPPISEEFSDMRAFGGIEASAQTLDIIRKDRLRVLSDAAQFVNHQIEIDRMRTNQERALAGKAGRDFVRWVLRVVIIILAIGFIRLLIGGAF